MKPKRNPSNVGVPLDHAKSLLPLESIEWVQTKDIKALHIPDIAGYEY